jgi:probable HAF family extracellular repeat protein
MFELGTLGGSISSARDINNVGQIVGTSVGGEMLAQNRAFLWTPLNNDPMANEGVMISLGVIDPDTFQARSQAEAINDSAVVVGSSKVGINFHAFRWVDGQGMIDLGTLGGTTSHAYDINNDGLIVGVATNAAGRSRAFKWFDTNGNGQSDDGEMIDIGTIEGNESHASTAFGVNNFGHIVGYSDTSGTPHAFVYRDGIMLDLNDLIDPASGWELIEARAINDSGQIVGRGNAPGRPGQAFLLNPITVMRIPGDATGNGVVDDEDAKTLAANWGQTGDWTQGDFNNDGVINALDASILAANWGYIANAETTAVPEPSVLAMVMSLVLLAGGCRCR